MMYIKHLVQYLALGAVALGRQQGKYQYIHFVFEEMAIDHPSLKSYSG